MLSQDASAQAAEKAVITGFNTKLAQRVASFAASTGVSILSYHNHGLAPECYYQSQTWFWDSNTAFTTVLDDPQAYGFVDAVSYGNTGDFWG